ncbi:hypothetical protein [Chroococcidiopsis cubana]|uniref:hypothetical protein n=1 Tax=Chroococcidiopsis cubana TaxID=171392 RepID=UPI000F8C7140|nr:hypothetical protein [Chroococcidiopsis cubana]
MKLGALKGDKGDKGRQGRQGGQGGREQVRRCAEGRESRGAIPSRYARSCKSQLSHLPPTTHYTPHPTLHTPYPVR